MASATATGRGGRKSQRGAPRSIPAPGHSHPAIPDHTPGTPGTSRVSPGTPRPPRAPPAAVPAAPSSPGPAAGPPHAFKPRHAPADPSAPRPFPTLSARRSRPGPSGTAGREDHGGDPSPVLCPGGPRGWAGTGWNSLSRRRDRGRWAAAPLGYGRKNKMIK